MTAPRARLDRAAERLRDYLLWLAARLTPGVTPQVSVPDHPVAVDWHEPVRYQYRVSARVHPPGAVYDPAVVRRAVAALTEAGWSVEVERSADESGAVQSTVIGNHDEFVVRIRVQEGYGGVIFTGETPIVAVPEEDSFVPPQPVVTAATVGAGAVLCYECAGLGWCPACQSRGWTATGPSGRQRCRECFGAKVCPVCRGAGELVIAELTSGDRAHYPDLPRTFDQGRADG
ncbi:hypothetical protein OHA40_11360 [Nocardia sp. NBC_00508]|uniref:hypothetical protein n=1 Tax=Nocardia sp. NBC_00508 TaxID=2975992 RepID=UPI002E807EF6|nr:hypothetical protein [Nocardia sp. NBC_00508]WUD68653.1 hypothetical protein OHA40_11360 [Nocardia sp. NBC_00508]